MKILAAIDNSDFAKHVLDKAIDLARTENAKLSVMTVVNFSPYFMGAGEMPPSVVDSVHANAKKLMKQAEQQAKDKGVTVDTMVRESYSPAAAIVEDAEKTNVDMIVVGHKGVSAIERFLVGSTAAKVVSHAPCSVLVVR
ncbi:universal stress protein [Oceanidesulfovibrio marinus]|uniref:Universal stress protein n=1 Tax=Oceanidesulfovibrio marinus TaxID=370038 RepID=A0A6P1ZNJ7_9BACT|nr:universal stress protein [Oceanidesulfovibrio marinus]QJT08769.1 universal stress protein [Oceanidesulfovibrio marinus]TVM36804.1 universal stress protein [Oceanidesulfovibrio marinus]